MRRLALLSVLVSGLALAGWSELPALTGAPQDILAPDAGTVLAASSGTSGQVVGWTVSDAGVSNFLTQAGVSFVSVGAFNGCVSVLGSNGALIHFPASCGVTPSLSGAGFSRLRILPGGISVVRFTPNASLDSIYVAPTPIGAYSATSPTWLGSNPRSLETARIGGVDYAVLNENAASLRVSIDGGIAFTVPISAAARDAVPFARLGKPGVVVLTTAGGAWLLPDLGAAGLETPITLPGGFVPQFVTMTTERGSDAGAGYGLMTSTTGVVLSPVPDPSRPGSVWIARGGAPALALRAHCVDARFCAAIGDGGVLHVLSNDAPPVVGLDAGAVAPGATVSLTAVAGDPDGDPVFVSWSSGTATVAPGTDLQGLTATLTVPAAAECTATGVAVALTVSDGLGAHDRTQTVTIPLAVATQAWISPGSATVAAGDPPVAFTGGSDAGCSAGTLTWSTTDGQMGSGDAFNFAVPATECSPDGGAYDVSVAWTDQAGHQSSATARVTVAPWGRPEAPAFETPVSQPAGTPKRWSPSNAAHACAMTPGFPDTQLVWALPTPPAGVSLTPFDGGLEVNAPDFCTAASVSVSAVRVVNGDPISRASDAGTLTVTIVPAPPPLGANTPFDVGLQVDAGVAFGQFTVDAGCRPLSLLSAEVTLGVPDASIVATTGALPVPGPWSLGIPASCGAGQFELVARLFDDGGFTGAVVRDTVPADSLPVLPGVASPDRLPVSCGLGVRGTLRVESADGGCATPVATWRQVGGPALTQAAYSGTSVDVQSVSKGLELVGERLSFEVDVGDGSGASATGRHEVLLVADPFVEISESTAPFPAQEEEALQVTVRLVNTATCDVSGLEVREALSGLAPAMDTLRLGDAAVTGELVDGTLTVRGVSLAAGEARTLSFRARPRLLSRGTLAGTVFLREQLVSTRPRPGALTGCGCQAADPAPWLLGLILLALRCQGALRARRRFE
ncbi:MAG: hypothetical protein AB1730_06040 [Myxococcota bacterium]